MPDVTTMKISLDTKEDSHDEIKKVIRMLQNLVGDSQEVFTNEPQAAQESSPMANIFGDTPNTVQEQSSTEQTTQSIEGAQTQETEEAQAGETTQSTDDLFAELFSEEELKKMEACLLYTSPSPRD